MYLEDTIAAISTPPGIGGIAIIRVSGKDAVNIVERIFRSHKNKKLVDVKSHTIHYGFIIDLEKKQTIDEVLVSVMKKPHTFTKEDIVEINCHGGVISTKRILEEVIYAGARIADAGEFTKRAFLNGRIDLVQAEAIIDIINSKTNVGLQSAVDQLEGSLSSRIFDIRSKMLRIAAHLQAAVDFPEDDIEELSEENLIAFLKNIKDEMKNLLETADMGKIIRDGLSTVIIGKPNVGKSSLLNNLLKENRAIVTEVPGTTRDIIEEYINLKGIPLKVIDTAGIRETDDIVERIGVEKSREFINKADLVILILDGSEIINENDKKIIDLVKNKKLIVLVNKVDLDIRIDMEYIRNLFEGHPIINVSAKKGIGVQELENTIHHLFMSGNININSDVMITNVRHKDSLVRAKKSISECIEAIDNGMPLDMIFIDLSNAIESLGEIIGFTVSEEIVDQIFREFCLGK
ncbi:tRNA uridine-5-carboxymethylaminomethyl(34) synthesis GTPase MnmE [Petroclostridium sp. X23]|uniref:tRNA uridine-5-carboxymethylaminomethyl(34) synthesis GTPase MnmE n=1 Tax=Petroclostridium sp. X23 TaxID=3045146 RepID=UPI0024ACE88C|nr:tRNA uridine-5-carboxymethylaminomethyl(34) synthesis GTPase MnmE [Petroclostridium sp. X23]WHH57253.1 tRNA uridine-5-carboxymethylaminomethyl(34) synthesis GTPase MnmE [Petroclostridium sp. X23]